MARMTRSQRRARRQAQAASAAGQSGGATPRRASRRSGRSRFRRRRRRARSRKEEKGSRRFIAECWGELKKVEWPTQSHLIQGTVVVLVACIIVGFYIWVCDIVSKNVVQDIFLR